MSSRRSSAAFAIGLCVVGGLALPGWAHVVLNRAEVPAATAVDLEFRAPVERENTTNKRIEAAVPAAFTVGRCTVPSSAWQCDVDRDVRPGSVVVTWDTPVAGSPQDLRFGLAVTTPRAAGDYKIPVVQTYSDGTVSRWIADGEPNPAPRLKVVAAGQPVSSAPPPSPAHSGGPAPSRTAGPTPGATASASGGGAAASPSSGAPTTAPSASASVGSSPAATPSAVGSATSTAEPGISVEVTDDGDDGGLPAGAVVGAALIGAAGLGTAAYLVRRRRT